MVRESADRQGLSLDKFISRGKRTRSKSKKPAHFLQVGRQAGMRVIEGGAPPLQ